jgi:hypothetical protein
MRYFVQLCDDDFPELLMQHDPNCPSDVRRMLAISQPKGREEGLRLWHAGCFVRLVVLNGITIGVAVVKEESELMAAGMAVADDLFRTTPSLGKLRPYVSQKAITLA